MVSQGYNQKMQYTDIVDNEHTQLLKQHYLWVIFKSFSTHVTGVRDRYILRHMTM